MAIPGQARVLVIGDQADRQTLADGLAAAGYDVVTADDSGQALDHLGAADVVVADLPTEGAADLLRVITASQRGLPVVLLAAPRTLEAAIAALRRGQAHNFLVKPIVDVRVLAETIAVTLAVHRHGADAVLPRRARRA